MYQELGNISIKRQTKGKLPSLPFVSIRNQILGQKFELSILFATPKVAQGLNIKHRDKSYIPNVLSFNVDTNSGELVFCLSKIRKEARGFGMSYHEFLGFLYIHGLLHLNGNEHGSTMDKLEQSIFNKYFGSEKNLKHGKNNSHRNRHRNISHSSSNRRVQKGRQ